MLQSQLDAVHDPDNVGARLPLNVQDHRRRSVHPRRLIGVLRPFNRCCYVREPNRVAILVSNDGVGVLLGLEELIVGVDGVRLPVVLQLPFGLVNVDLPDHRSQLLEADTV